MDWSDQSVQFGSRRLDGVLHDFCEAALQQIRKRALELLERLRACRVTLDYLRHVSSADVVSGKTASTSAAATANSTSPVSVMTPLDDKATNRVKGYLRRRVEKLKNVDGEEFRRLVPQDRDAFERGFDAFVESCMEDDTRRFRNSWFEEHVSSGAAQPQLWKIYVGFQRQLRDTCAMESRKPLPPPLFMTKEEDVDPSPGWCPYPVPLRTVTYSYFPSSYAQPPPPPPPPPPQPQRHCRTQSCAEVRRYPQPPHPHAYHTPMNAPCLVVPTTYHLRQQSVHGYHAAAPDEPHHDYSDPYIVGRIVQDDNDVPLCCFDNVMMPSGYSYVSPRMLYNHSNSPSALYFCHG